MACCRETFTLPFTYKQPPILEENVPKTYTTVRRRNTTPPPSLPNQAFLNILVYCFSDYVRIFVGNFGFSLFFLHFIVFFIIPIILSSFYQNIGRGFRAGLLGERTSIMSWMVPQSEPQRYYNSSGNCTKHSAPHLLIPRCAVVAKTDNNSISPCYSSLTQKRITISSLHRFKRSC